MRVGSLFSGAGLGDLGWLMAGMDIQWQVEVDEYCQKVLDLRFPETDKYYDIKTFKPKEAKPVDIVAGGFPCQPFSVAGNQKGDQDDRNLWPEMFRVVKEIRPTWVVGENVSGLIPLYLDNVLADLESEGYATRTFVFPAHALGASHRRERIWVVGYSEHNGRVATKERESAKTRNGSCAEGKKQTRESKGPSKSSEDVGDTRGSGSSSAINEKSVIGRATAYVGERSSNMAHPEKQHSDGFNDKRRCKASEFRDGCSKIRTYWQTEPRICRVVDGCPSRVDRLKALGNGQVMACTAFIGEKIMEFERIGI